MAAVVPGYLTDYNASGYPEKYSESCVAEAPELMEFFRQRTWSFVES